MIKHTSKINLKYINQPVPSTMPIQKRVHDLTGTFLAQLVDSLGNTAIAFPCPFPF